MRLADHVAALAPHFTLVKPPGAGPFKTVVQLHGCDGRKPLRDRWGAVVVEADAAALIVDSYAPRGISRLEAYATVCTGLHLWGRARAADLLAALAWARAQDWYDPQRFIAAGWSHGGWTIADALALRLGDDMARATGLSDLSGDPLAGLVGAFLNYPYLGTASMAARRPWWVTPRAVAIVGGRDTIVGSAAPRRALERLRGRGAPIDIHVFETATHAFDESEARDPRVRFDAALTMRAQELLRSLIGEL
jgi:dienelactone hydrolase